MTVSVLVARKVSKSFGGFQAIRNLSLEIRRGELRAIIGPNGAGKSTFLDLVTGRCRPDAGEIVFEGRVDLTRLKEYEIARLGIGRKFQTPAVYPNHTVWENMVLALGAGDSLVRVMLRKIDDTLISRGKEILHFVGLEDLCEVSAGRLSHGQKQWLEIGILLAQNARLLLLDEPVAGMTQEERWRTAELLRGLVPERTIVVIEHDMGFVHRVADWVTVLHEGSVLTEGIPEEVQRDDRVIEVYLGKQVRTEGVGHGTS